MSIGNQTKISAKGSLLVGGSLSGEHDRKLEVSD